MKLANRFKPHRTHLISRTRPGSELSTLHNLLSDEGIARCLRDDPWFALSRRVAHAAQRMAAAREINRRFALELAEVPDEFYEVNNIRKEAA